MKLSLAWIFDHIDADWKTQDVNHIMALFNKTTAEIECFYPVSFDLSNFFIVQGHNLLVPELSKTVQVSTRTDQGTFFMVKKEGDIFRWATLADFGSEKDGLLPALDVSDTDLMGNWRSTFEPDDIILEVDNKSITHRPDMWGHRGFAREIAAFLKLPLRPKEQFLKKHQVLTFVGESQPTNSTPITLINKAPQACIRFTGLYCNLVTNKPSNLLMTSRLLKVGSRPMNALVDITNYLTHDWSQPVHAYDAEKISGKQVVVRMAHQDEKFVLLDGNELVLSNQDLVIADAQKPMCLAGVKGGLDSGVSATTKSIFFEAATFQASTVRLSSQRHKIRTDSSARFEKTLDPNQTIDAVERFLKLCQDFNVPISYADEIISLGKDVEPPVIEVTHDFLERRAGISFEPGKIVDLLSRLEFHVLKSLNEAKQIVYLITPPSFRATKDIKIKEDILEEVVRLYGFNKIPLDMPRIMRMPFDFSPITRLQNIKQYCAHGLGMVEQQNYALQDEQNISSLGLTSKAAVSLLNPISEYFQRLITSLVPGLLKNIKENHVHHDTLSFFECGRVWILENKEPKERKQVSGIFFAKRQDVDFYDCKDQVNNLFVTLGFKESDFEWRKADKQPAPWYRSYQTALLFYKNSYIGCAGKVDPLILNKLDVDAACDAFVFELDGDFLLNQKPEVPAYKPLSKFQDTYFDLSLFVPLALETAQLIKAVTQVSPLIQKVELVDFFEKQEWTDVRAITLRVWLVSDEKTLEKTDIEAVWQQSVSVVEKLGSTVRM